MKLYSKTKTNVVSKNLYFKAFSITIMALTVFQVLNSIYPEISFAPLSGTILVFALSLLFTPSIVLICSVLIAGYVFFSLITIPSFSFSESEQVIRLLVRSATFIVASSIAVLASTFRCRLADMLSQARKLLGLLPVPIILSNSTGRVVWANDAARQALGSESPEGRLYLDVLPSDGTPLDYPLLFCDPNSERFVCGAVPDYKLKFNRFRTGKEALLVTTFFPEDAALKKDSAG